MDSQVPNSAQPTQAAEADGSVVVEAAPAVSPTKYPIPHPFEYEGKFYQGQVELVEQIGEAVYLRDGNKQVASGEHHYNVYEVLMLDGRPVQALRIIGSGIYNPHTSH